MRNQLATLPPNHPDPDLLNRLFFVQQVCLVLVVQLGIVSLAAHASAYVSALLPKMLTTMPVLSAATALLCATGLLVAESTRQRNPVWMDCRAALFAVCAALAAVADGALVLRQRPIAGPSDRAFHLLSGTSSLATPAAFLILALLVFLVRESHPIRSAFADALACSLALLVLILFADQVFSALQVGEAAKPSFVSHQTLACLLLLTLATLLRRAEYGVLSFLLGFGMGSRIGRNILPFLFVLPFLREFGRARLLGPQAMPSAQVTAILTSVSMLVSVALLCVVAFYINHMQFKIQDLTLRDELTGLYNVRGFNLLADQALLLAKRNQQDFGVLFIDLDNLKQINDSLGHSLGSASLVETARLLSATFRDTDVIGRVGGDEFVVAGQFDPETIDSAIQRLKSCAAAKSAQAGRRFALSFSTGYASTRDPRDTVKELVMRADQAMYDQKRRKKLRATA